MPFNRVATLWELTVCWRWQTGKQTLEKMKGWLWEHTRVVGRTPKEGGLPISGGRVDGDWGRWRERLQRAKENGWTQAYRRNSGLLLCCGLGKTLYGLWAWGIQERAGNDKHPHGCRTGCGLEAPGWVADPQLAITHHHGQSCFIGTPTGILLHTSP